MQLNLPEHDPIKLNEFYCDILITFIESGTYDWFKISGYKYWYPDLEGSAKPFIINNIECANVNAYMRYENHNDMTYLGNWSTEFMMDQRSLYRAFERLFSGPITGLHESYRFDLIKAYINLEAGDIDCDMADIIMQIYCYNEIVFS